MVSSFTPAVCLFAALLAVAPMVFAESAEALFAQGVTAFKAGDYPRAARAFHDATMLGYDPPALFYNLGASYYKLGWYEEAEEAFGTASRDPSWSALAYYNMGLSAYQRGERSGASVYFERAWRSAQDEKLRALSRTMLERSGVSVDERTRVDVALSVGYDSNVTLTRDSQALLATQEADAFSEFSAFASNRWIGGPSGVRWDAGIYNLNYRDFDEFDFTEVLLGADKLQTLGNWNAEFGASFENHWLYQINLERVASVRLQGLREWPGQRDLLVKAKFSRVHAANSNFDFLTGSRAELEASTARPQGNGSLRFGLTHERNRREDLEFNDEFFSFSPLRYTAWLLGTWPVFGNWRFEPTLRYSRSRYADPDRRVEGTLKTRADQQGEITLRMKRQITTRWQLVGEYSFIDNESNFGEYSYSRRIATLRLTRLF